MPKKKNRYITCMNFGEREIDVLVVNSLDEKVVWRQYFLYNFEVLKNTGTVFDPERLAPFIQNIFREYKLPPRVKISLGLRYVDLKRIYLPLMPFHELHPIILDEASRESIFSYAGGKIAVAYRILGTRTLENGLTQNDILIATIPQEVIDSIIATVNETRLILVALQPSVDGLAQIVAKYIKEFTPPKALLYVKPRESELYIWEERGPQFWRYIPIGAAEPERLQNEVFASLEYFRTRDILDVPITHVFIAGENVSLTIGENVAVEYLALEKWADLYGAGILGHEEHPFSFPLGSIRNEPESFPANLAKYWLWAAGMLLLLNIWLGWDLHVNRQRLYALNEKNISLQNELAQRKSQLGVVESRYRENEKINEALRPDLFLENIRRIVPDDMRFTNLSVDIDAGQMRLEGLCLSQESLAGFSPKLLTINGVKSIETIESVQQDHGFMQVYFFKLGVTLEGQKNG